eukprot:11194678-Alexandrium_andersonii.AAC.1
MPASTLVTEQRHSGGRAQGTRGAGPAPESPGGARPGNGTGGLPSPGKNRASSTSTQLSAEQALATLYATARGADCKWQQSREEHFPRCLTRGSPGRNSGESECTKPRGQ